MSDRKLGRGLDFLIKRPVAPDPEPAPAPPPVEGLAKTEIAVGEITPNPFQPRRIFGIDELNELIESVREHGVIQPIAVRRGTGGYEIISGERRWRACQELGLETIPVVIHAADDQKMLELALIENIQREDLNAIEKAKAYRQLIREFNLTQEEAARRLGVKRATVANHLRLLELASEIQDLVSSGQLSMGHARALLAIAEPAERARIARRVIDAGLSVRDVEKLAAEASAPRAVAAPKSLLHPQLVEVRDRIRDALQSRVEIRGNTRRGKVLIDFRTTDELNRLLELVERAAREPQHRSEMA